MKKVMKRIWTLGLLLMISVVASAQEPPVKVDLNESYTGGTVVVSGYDTSAGDGSVVVTITVSPAEGYKIAKSDILVVSTVPASGTREGSPSIADNLQLNGNDPENLSDKRDYTFTVPSGLGAWVKEANFSEVGEQPQPGPQPQPQEPTTNISAEGSDLKWDYAEDTGTLVITGTGSTMNFGGEGSDPLASIRTQITSVVIEKGVTGLGANLFAGCTSLTSITIDNAETVLALGAGAIPEGVTVTVPARMLDEYNDIDGWKSLSMVASGNVVGMTGIKFSANNQYDTYVSNQSIQVPSVLTAIIITGISSNGLDLKEVDVIPAGVPVLVYNKRNLDKSDYCTSAIDDATKGGVSSLLTVAKEDTPVALGDAYILHNDVFYYSQAGTIPQGHIYLPNKPNSPDVRTRGSYSLNGDGTTAINPLYINKVESQSSWYTLDGRQLPTTPTKKGIYIKDGKKVIIK
jgi:hypothetical protein